MVCTPPNACMDYGRLVYCIIIIQVGMFENSTEMSASFAVPSTEVRDATLALPKIPGGTFLVCRSSVRLRTSCGYRRFIIISMAVAP